MVFIVEPRNSVAHRCLPVHGIHVQDWSYNGLSCTCMCNYIDVYNLALSNYSYQSYMYMYGFMIKVNTVVYLTRGSPTNIQIHAYVVCTCIGLYIDI